MEKQFVDLFDQEKYGFNFFVVIGLFLGGFIGMILLIFRGRPCANHPGDSIQNHWTLWGPNL